MTPMSIHADIRIMLQEAVRRSVKESNFERYFKEGEAPKAYGLAMGPTHLIAKEVITHIRGWNKEDVFSCCQLLFESQIIEETIIACDLAYAQRKSFEVDDFKTFESWIQKYIDNWATCDTFCNKTVGFILMRFPELLPRLVVWAESPNRWMRRAAAVSLIVPAKKGMFKETVFSLADMLMRDTDDMVQKGYGWMLKSFSESDPEAVFDWVNTNKLAMPRTALRYAIEKMSAASKTILMSK